MMKLFLLLALLTGSEGSSEVVGLLGGGVTLPCTYDIGRYGRLSVCWGRGSIPASGCRDQLVSTNGLEATGASDRHRLLGRLEDGDVSMTILNVSRADAGRYGCRVDIPGWFNDDKHHFDVVVEEASETTTSMTSTGESTTNQGTPATTQSTRGHVPSTLRRPTSSSSSIAAELSGGPGPEKPLGRWSSPRWSSGLRPESLRWRTSTRWRLTRASTSSAPEPTNPPPPPPDPTTLGAGTPSSITLELLPMMQHELVIEVLHRGRGVTFSMASTVLLLYQHLRVLLPLRPHASCSLVWNLSRCFSSNFFNDGSVILSSIITTKWV
ncbi:hepatitis A virus cellular receptor 1 homolog isoform X1 [Pungitius pungitius]|uniref:hepatitis A virus cellular receptor 1 homolog isoform X1 n=1 Tax=Pungitius pungitius TaxID=134920 RepID=UPI002E11A340